MKYVPLEEILAIHHRILQETGGTPGIRDLNLLQSAVARPRASFGGRNLYQTIWFKGAALMHSLILNHPFTDGNKRTAFAAVVRFLKINGVKFQVDKKAIVDFTLGIEKKEHNLEQIAAWLKKTFQKDLRLRRLVKKISFLSSNQKIAGTLLTPELETGRSLPGVVFYHGRGSSQKAYLSRAEAVVKKGIICLTFDFRGCGESEGEFSRLTIEDGIGDALAAYDFLGQQKQVDENRIGICGRSLGGYLAALVSAKRKVKSLVLSAPAIYKDGWIDGAYPSVPIREIKNFLNGNSFEDTRAIKAIKKFKGNLFIIGNERDEIIPEAVMRAYYHFAINAEHREIGFIKGAGHRLDKPEFNEEFKKLIAAWFTKTL